MAEADNEPSYIDYDTFLSPDFSPTTFANSLVLSTNNPSDTPIDLSTPLSKVLFDIQEIDTHIHTISTKAALPLLTSLQASSSAAETIVNDLSAQVQGLTEGYERLETEVGDRYEEANAVRQVVERLWETVQIGRDVSRCLQLCRQLEAQMSDVHPQPPPNSKQQENHTALPRAASTLSTLQRLLNPQPPTALLQIDLIKSLSTTFLTPTERTLHTRCAQLISQFSLSSLASTSTTTYAQSEDTKSRTTSACLALQTLNPTLLLQALQAYLRTALTSSLASLARALANLPTLERTLLEVSARCQNVVALESLLSTLRPPSSSTSSTPESDDRPTLLHPLLAALDTSSLPSYFWRTLAEGLAPRVADLVNKGGPPARALRGARERVREGVRECVLRGSRGPGGGSGGGGGKGEWEREAAVMVGSVVGLLGR